MAGSAHLPPSGAAGGLRRDSAGHRGEEERHQAPAGRRGPAVPPLRGRTDQGGRRRHVPHVDLACSPGRSELSKVSKVKDTPFSMHFSIYLFLPACLPACMRMHMYRYSLTHSYIYHRSRKQIPLLFLPQNTRGDQVEGAILPAQAGTKQEECKKILGRQLP